MCEVPGEQTKMSTHLMGMGQELMQSFKPVNNICQHVVGVHFYDGCPNRQLVAHHFCSHLNEEVRQCPIYDSNEKDARLIGIEYIISERLFATLPEDEKKYWHSHAYEVKSGIIVAPQIPERIERMDLEKLVTSYGKTWHFWQVDRGDPLPFGAPTLMMSACRDGQILPDILAQKDKVTGISTKDRMVAREAIPWPTVLPGADVGLKGGNLGGDLGIGLTGVSPIHAGQTGLTGATGIGGVEFESSFRHQTGAGPGCLGISASGETRFTGPSTTGL